MRTGSKYRRSGSVKLSESWRDSESFRVIDTDDFNRQLILIRHAQNRQERPERCLIVPTAIRDLRMGGTDMTFAAGCIDGKPLTVDPNFGPHMEEHPGPILHGTAVVDEADCSPRRHV